MKMGLLFTQQPGTCCQAALEHDSGVSRLLLRSKTLNGPANITVYEIRVNSNENGIAAVELQEKCWA
jgi:hypothetical protein